MLGQKAFILGNLTPISTEKKSQGEGEGLSVNYNK